MPKDKIPIIEKKKEKAVEVTTFDADRKSKELDVFFKYVIITELPAGITAKTKIGKIEGINSNILKNEAIWLYDKGYTEEKLKEEIKPIFDKNGWTFGDLLGWFKKAQKGDIKEINKGELYNWCKIYAPELTKFLNLEVADLIELDLGEEDIDKDYALKLVEEDKQYSVVQQFIKDHNKYAYRQQFAGILSFLFILGQLIKDVFIHKEKVNGSAVLSHPLDLRINLIRIKPSGTGKSVSLDFTNLIIKGLNLVARQVTDFTDAGLIGSVDKPDKFGPNITYGIFKDSDFITCDEAATLFENNPHKEGVLRRFNIALNTLNQPSQRIYKSMRWGELDYSPHFSTYFISVPFLGFEEKLKTGFAQRQLIYIEDEAIEERLKSIKEDISRISFATSPDKREKIKMLGYQRYEYWKEIFDNLKKFSTETKFEQSPEIKDYIDKKINPLFKITSKIKNIEVQSIMFSFLTRYLDHLYRLIFHSAVIRQSKTIEKIDVDFAYSIIKKTYLSILYYIEVNAKVIEDNLQDRILAFIYSLMSEDKPKIRSGELIKSVQNRFKKSQGTIFTLLGEYVSKRLLVKEDNTRGGKERVVYYKKPFTK